MSHHLLWYRDPAGADWTRALPIGCGRLGAMVFGNVVDERIQLNEDSVWNGGPRDRTNPDALAAVPVIRELLLAGKLGEAAELTNDALAGVPDIMRHYEPLGDILLTVRHPAGEVTDYRRELDLETATVRVRYRCDGVTYGREYLASHPDQVIAIHLVSSVPGTVSFKARLERGPRDNYASRYQDAVTPLEGTALELTGTTAGAQGVSFAACLRVAVTGGHVRTIGETLIVDGADEAVLLLAAATTYREADPALVSRRRARQAADRSWESLYLEHLAEYRHYFDRVRLTLSHPGAGTITETLPTDIRLACVEQGLPDPGLDALYFHYGRYLLISASRPGSLPANLQGIWNGEFTPPWGSKYTININTEMNYWPAELCNLTELHFPLFDLLERTRESGRRAAEGMYGCRGFVVHHNTDLWGDAWPTDRNLAASYWPMGAAWLCLHLWEHYAFTGNREFLEAAYPTLREAVEFFLDFLIDDPQGRLVTCPTSSPENTYRLPNGETGTLCAGASMDNQILDTLFRRCIAAAETLGIDDLFRVHVEAARRRLPPPAIGRHGQLMEWPDEFEEVEPGHRHVSHLFALYPGDQISPRYTPELAQAARVSLERRLAAGGGHTGWSRAWIINFWARLHDGAQAYANLQALLAHSTLSNLFDNHPPFQIDGNFGGTAGIAEMLLQSAHGELDLLPALPSAWSEGKVAGLCARGGFVVDMTWGKGCLLALTLRSTLGGPTILRYGKRVVTVETAVGQTLTLDGELQGVAGGG
jgi:alpha-L-fucosidase 2